MWDDFRQFVMRGNVVDMAIGIIIGGAFGTIAKSLVDDLLMPPLGLLLGRVDFQDLFIVLRAGAAASGPYPTVAQAQEAGAVTLNYGRFINNVVSFLLVAAAMFFVVRAMARWQAQGEAEAPEASTRECPHCRLAVPRAASRCPHCTSTLEPA